MLQFQEAKRIKKAMDFTGKSKKSVKKTNTRGQSVGSGRKAVDSKKEEMENEISNFLITNDLQMNSALKELAEAYEEDIKGMEGNKI